MSLANPPKCRRTPWRIGSSASKRVARELGVDADAFGGAMIHRDEHRRLAFAGERRRQIGSPHGVHRLGDDGAVVVPRPARRADPPRRQQVVLAHQPKHPAQRGPGSGIAQSRPDLAMTLAMERAGGEHGADRRRQRLVGHRAPLARAVAGGVSGGGAWWR